MASVHGLALPSCGPRCQVASVVADGRAASGGPHHHWCPALAAQTRSRSISPEAGAFHWAASGFDPGPPPPDGAPSCRAPPARPRRPATPLRSPGPAGTTLGHFPGSSSGLGMTAASATGLVGGTRAVPRESLMCSGCVRSWVPGTFLKASTSSLVPKTISRPWPPAALRPAPGGPAARPVPGPAARDHARRRLHPAVRGQVHAFRRNNREDLADALGDLPRRLDHGGAHVDRANCYLFTGRQRLLARRGRPIRSGDMANLLRAPC